LSIPNISTASRSRAELAEGWSWKLIDQELVEIETRRLTASETLTTLEALEAAVLDLIT